MPRPQQLHKDGLRRTITFRPDLDQRLRVMAAERRLPISVIVEELVERGLREPQESSVLQGLTDIEAQAVDFPANWDGSDLRVRLYILRMRQADLSAAIHVQLGSLNRWVNGMHPFPPELLPGIQEALKSWRPGPIEGFREGSRSPRI